MDRNEVGALLVAAGLGGPNEHALMWLLAMNGLRISEALGADIDKLGLERGHRTRTVLRKGAWIESRIAAASRLEYPRHPDRSARISSAVLDR